VEGYRYNSCCGKTICSGCIHAVALRDDEEKCPFCRTPAPITDEELIKRNEKRIEAKDAMAIYGLGCVYSEGKLGLRQNYAKALELFHRAAELGHHIITLVLLILMVEECKKTLKRLGTTGR